MSQMRKKGILRTTVSVAVVVAAIFAATCLACAFGGCSSDEKTVSSSQNVTGISMECGSELTLTISQTASMAAVVETDGGNYTGTVEWTSSNEDVASFLVGGVLVAKGMGTTLVTASVPGTEHSATCLVTVTGRGTLRVGVKDDVKNFGYLNEEGEYEGMEIDLAVMIGEALDYDDVELFVVTTENREDMLTYNYVDCVIATYSKTDDRAQAVDFSTPYYTDYVQVLASGRYADKGINSLFDAYEYVCTEAGASFDEDGELIYDEGVSVTSCRVAYASGSTAATAFDDYCAANGIGMETEIGQIFEYVPFSDYEACEKALEDGDVDLFVADRAILGSYAGETDYVLSDALEEQEYCVGTARSSGDEEFIFDTFSLSNEIDNLLNEWLEDGTIAGLIAKYGL